MKSTLVKNTAYFLATITSLFFVFTVSTALASPITDIDDAVSFCQSLPDGTANKSHGYCAFTRPGSPDPCVVSSVGSFPKFGSGCDTTTFTLQNMVGKDKDQLRAEALTTGGITTQPSDPGSPGTTSGSSTIDNLIQSTVDLMAALTGIVIVLSIIIGGIQYMTARDNSNQVAAAKNRILMSVLSLILFIFAYTILQWLVPGGIF